MNDQEFENIIRKELKTSAIPDRASFARVLSELNDPVTENKNVRYNSIQIKMSNIINSKVASFIAIWRSKRVILMPSLILLLFIGAFSLSGQTGKYNLSIEQLVQQEALIDELDIVDDDDPVILTSFDDPYINELSAAQDEI